MSESDSFHVLLQGPDWAALPREQMRLASSRCGSPSAVTSNFLWSPTAADCAVDSANRPDTTRCAKTPPACTCRIQWLGKVEATVLRSDNTLASRSEQ